MIAISSVLNTDNIRLRSVCFFYLQHFMSDLLCINCKKTAISVDIFVLFN